jgi:hypothetical protein
MRECNAFRQPLAILASPRFNWHDKASIRAVAVTALRGMQHPTTVPYERPADACRVVDVRPHFIWAEGQRAMVDLLHDPAIDVLTDATLAGSPTSAQAVAKVDEARALLAVASSQFPRSVGANAGATWTDLKPRSGD